MSERRALLFMAAIVIVVLLILRFLVTPDPSQRNYEIFTEMVYSQAGESFASASVMPGGLVMQPLPEGVVVRGRLPFLYGDGDEEAQRAGAELTNPLERNEEVVAEGGKLYGIYCLVCHASDGEGRGPAVARGMLPPPSLFSATSMGMRDGQMFHILTRGRGNMASYAAQLSPTERWAVIHYVRQLQESR